MGRTVGKRSTVMPSPLGRVSVEKTHGRKHGIRARAFGFSVKGSMRVDASPTTAWPKLLDNRTGKKPTTVRIDWGDGAKRLIGEGVTGKFRGVNGLFMLVARDVEVDILEIVLARLGS